MGKIKPHGLGVLGYLRKVGGTFLEAALLTVAVILFYILLLYFTKSAWHIFEMAQYQQDYVSESSYSYRMANDFLTRDFVDLAVRTTLSAVAICFLVAFVCQFLHISRHLYFSRGFWGKVFLFGFPLIYLVALHVRHLAAITDLDIAVTASFVPTVCVFMSCFKYARDLIPEMEDLIKK
ncbi:MAG: hypothetical protein PHY31_07170 [Smithellaceae bacterium]|nr:hypothetical protein [Smithellaceae bacterium]